MTKEEKLAVIKERGHIQFISQEVKGWLHSEIIEEALLSGIKWFQLRIKDRPEEYLELEARKCSFAASAYKAVFILNDNVTLAKMVKADGVHLGKNDMDPGEARKILGNEFIIGGTANTFEDIVRLAESGVDYIGLGPFRFTTTKKNLSPVLGTEGYKTILEKMKEAGIDIPLVAIGGIQTTDFEELLSVGVNGLAVSGCIAHDELTRERAQEALEKMANVCQKLN